ncbi:MAG: 4Fe-4S binding protein [Planctomycetota bacterium]
MNAKEGIRLWALGIGLGVVGFLSAPACLAEERFPPPDFDSSGYQIPQPATPQPAAHFHEILDIALLGAALALAAYLIFRKRSRQGVFWLMLFSVAYFGFWRKGCVCPIGALQNVAEAVFSSGLVLPVVVAVFFFLPLVMALFFGRVYCAAVCPHGALQDLVLAKPFPVPPWLSHSLGLLAYIYLGCGVLFAGLGSAYIICEYDPFVSLFRRSGSANMLLLSACFVLLSVFVARPYCRFLCPYGAVLRILSQLTRWRVKIYPDRCIDCHLCDDSCPFGAIHKTTLPEQAAPAWGKGRVLACAALLPLLVVLGGWFGARLAAPFSRLDSTVRLSDRIRLEESGAAEDTTDPSKAFRRTGQAPEELYAAAAAVYGRFRAGSWWLGAWVGLVLGFKLLTLCWPRRYTEYEADRSLCVACARCFAYCPGEKGLLVPKEKELKNEN